MGCIVNFVLALVMVALGLGIVGYLGGLLWQAALGPLSAVLESSRLKRCEELTARGDEAVRDGEMAKGLYAFSRAFYLSPVRSSAQATAVARHHTGLLSRLIAASDRRSGGGVGLISLAAADRAVRKRKELQSAYIGAIQTGDRGRRQRIKAAMTANAQEVRSAVDDVCREIMTLQRGGAALH